MQLFYSETKQRLNLVQLLVAVVLANMNPVFSKAIFLQGWDPLQLYFSVLLVMVVVLTAHEIIALESGGRWGMTRKDLLGTLISTMTGGIISPLLFFYGLKLVGASDAIILTSVMPFFVVCFAVVFLKEKFTPQLVLGGAFLVGGLTVLLWPDLQEFQLSTGATVIIVSSAIGALTTIVHKKFIVHRHLDSIVLVRSLLSLIVLAFWMIIVEDGDFTFLTTPQNPWLILALPLCSFLLPFFLYYRALRTTKAVEAGIIAAMARVIGLVAASSLLGEALTGSHLVSMTCVVVGIILINVPLSRWRVVPSRLLETGPLRK